MRVDRRSRIHRILGLVPLFASPPVSPPGGRPPGV